MRSRCLFALLLTSCDGLTVAPPVTPGRFTFERVGSISGSEVLLVTDSQTGSEVLLYSHSAVVLLPPPKKD